MADISFATLVMKTAGTSPTGTLLTWSTYAQCAPVCSFSSTSHNTMST